MEIYYIGIAAITIIELIFLFLIAYNYHKINKMEKVLFEAQKSQYSFLRQIESNTRMEQNIVDSIAARQIDLKKMLGLLEDRSKTLHTLLDLATGITRSSNFTRDRILQYKAKGYSTNQIRQLTGASRDEITLILAS